MRTATIIIDKSVAAKKIWRSMRFRDIDTRYTDDREMREVVELAAPALMKLLLADYTLVPWNQPTIDMDEYFLRRHCRNEFRNVVRFFQVEQRLTVFRQQMISVSGKVVAPCSRWPKSLPDDVQQVLLSQGQWRDASYDECLAACPHVLRQLSLLGGGDRLVSRDEFFGWFDSTYGAAFVAWDSVGFSDERDAVHFKVRWTA